MSKFCHIFTPFRMPPVFGFTDPYALFTAWYTEACGTEPNDPSAMSLATVDASGQPSVRIVLFRDLVDGGLHFFTNYHSRKARDLAANPKSALCFHWKSLLRQIRIEGVVTKTSAEISDRYFYGRHPESQLGAWASDQSAPLADRATLEQRLHDTRARYADQPTPRPAHWGGYCLTPHTIEFWQDRPHRLHDRELFTRHGDVWQAQRLYP